MCCQVEGVIEERKKTKKSDKIYYICDDIFFTRYDIYFCWFLKNAFFCFSILKIYTLLTEQFRENFCFQLYQALAELIKCKKRVFLVSNQEINNKIIKSRRKHKIVVIIILYKKISFICHFISFLKIFLIKLYTFLTRLNFKKMLSKNQ